MPSPVIHWHTVQQNYRSQNAVITKHNTEWEGFHFINIDKRTYFKIEPLFIK